MDVGTLKSLPADTIRVLVWILSFMTFGYATAEFEVTAERLGVYRPEEHIEFVPPPLSPRVRLADPSATRKTTPITKMPASTTSASAPLSARSNSISTPTPA